MYDYAQAQLLGRATSDATISYGEDGSVNKAVFSLALNIPIRRGGKVESRTLFRRVMVLGTFATYVAQCQEEDGLRSRLVNVVGTMDDERTLNEDGTAAYREVIRVAPGAGCIKIIDRRSQSDG